MEVVGFQCVAKEHSGETDTGEVVLIFDWQGDICY